MKIEQREFVVDSDEGVISCRCTFMTKSCHVWCGSQRDTSMGGLMVCLPSKYEKLGVHATLLDGELENSLIVDWTRRLSTKYGIEIFISAFGLTESQIPAVNIKLREILTEIYQISQ